jgi:type II secretory pathway pseudopilin PulG
MQLPALSSSKTVDCDGLASHRAAFTLVEALMAISILAVAGGAIMLGMTAAVQTTGDSREAAIATGIAEQLIDEVMGKRYAAIGVGPYQTGLGPNSWETAGAGRERFDDTDDYHNFVASPIEGIWGHQLGQGDDRGGLRHPAFRLPSGYFADWGQKIEVYYVSETNNSVRLTGNNTSNFRAVEVKIFRHNNDGSQSILANVKRVYAYVP